MSYGQKHVPKSVKPLSVLTNSNSYKKCYSVMRFLCFSGTYNQVYEAPDVSLCLPCIAGYFCPTVATTAVQPCTKSFYSDTGAAVCTLCEAGHYCDDNATSITTMMNDMICPAGLECLPGRSTVPDLINDKCRLGHYCLRGNIDPLPTPCPKGTFNGQYGLAELSQCQQCTPEFYCIPDGLTTPSGPCPGGYFCPLGTAEPDTLPCPIGFYRNGSAKATFQDCTVCISGFYCDQEGLAEPISCPAGYFCVAGSTTKQSCPLGTYSNSLELRRSTDCAPCPGGYYCDGWGRTSPTGPCDAGFYCRERAYTSAPPEGLTGGACPAGGYCPARSAVATACPVGRYSKSVGAKSASDCIPCDPGFYCAGSSSTEASRECSAGYYCTSESGIPTQHETPAGHYTLPGAFKPEPCPMGQYQPAVRSESCLICPQGYYCNGTGTVTQTLCPEGYYCPEGSEFPTPCPRGTFLKAVGKYQENHCNPCTPGYACEVVGLPDPVTLCHAGHYCSSQVNTSTPIGLQPYGDLCQPGYFCPEGTAEYVHNPCPNGTFSNYSGNQAESDCSLCEPGEVCFGEALTAPNGICAAGYFCRNGAKTDKPRDGGTTGDLCTVGSFCPIGTGKSFS